MAASFINSLLPGYSSPGSNTAPNEEDIVKKGELTKQKNMKKRYFVLRKDGSSRLEYYESKRKFVDGSQPRKKYELNKCYTISRVDTKHGDRVFALFVNAECVTLIADTKESMQDWISKLQQQKQAAGNSSSVEHKHIWYVDIPQRSLATTNNLVGPHLVCLNNCSLSLVGNDSDYITKKEFKLSTIRQCGFADEFFFIELGRSSCIKAGFLWMKAEDNFIATNMHNIVTSAMTRNSYSCNESGRERIHSICTLRHDNDLAPTGRTRADSTPSRPRCRTTSESFSHATSPTSSFDPFGPYSLACSFTSFSSNGDENPRQTPDRDHNQSDDFNEYLAMTPSDNVNNDPHRDFTGEDRNGYILPSSLPGFQRRCSHSPGFSSELGSPSGCSSCTPHGNSTPVSPLGLTNNPSWRPFPTLEQLPSPQVSSSGSHSGAPSRSSSLLNEYVSMQSGVSPFLNPEVTAAATSPSTSNAYLQMGPGPGIAIDIKRVASTPTPIPISPHIEFHERSINSGNSSLTSGTDSSDLLLNGMGTPSSNGSTLGQASGIAGDDLQMRPLRTNSIGSKPENKRKNSAPMLVGSPGSHSWSGTPGSHFRNIGATKGSSRDGNHLLLDYSGNKSFDNITEAKDKKSFWPFTSHRRQHSMSKSSDAPNLGSSREKKLSEGDSIHRPIDIPLSSHKDYCQMNFTGNSPRTAPHDIPGYLPMHPPVLSGSSTTLRIASSFLEQQRDMSSSMSSCGSQDGYVDMTQGSSPGSLILNSSSSSSSSLNILGRNRRTGNIINSIGPADLPSPLEEDSLDLEFCIESDTNKKKSRKSSKRRSYKVGNKKKKSDPGLAVLKGSEGEAEAHKNKGGPFSSFTNLLIKKPHSTWFPLSPQGNSKLHPFGSSSACKGKELKETSGSPPHATDSSIKTEQEPKNLSVNDSSHHNANTPQAITRSTLEKICESSSKSKSVLELSSKCVKNSPIQVPFSEKSVSLCEMFNKSLKIEAEPEKAIVASPPSPNFQSLKILNSELERNYVNMTPGISVVSSSENDLGEKSMGSPRKLSSSHLSLKILPNTNVISSELVGRLSSEESIPFSCIEPKSATDIDILTSTEQSHNIERSRSHSGPGASSMSTSFSRNAKRREADGRAASACSSPISSSPPTSPALGSVSSMSSLSEGGLSSASSTCTVVNVGTSRVPSQHNTSNNNSTAQSKQGKSLVPQPIETPHDPVNPGAIDKESPMPAQVDPKCQTTPIKTDSLNSSNLRQQSSSGSKTSLNYASLDLGTSNASETSPRSRRENSSNVSDDSSLDYAHIDFNKSEGLRNTSLARDSCRH